MAVVGVFVKQPGENYTVEVDYTSKLPGTAIISSGVVEAIDLTDDSDVSATVLTSTTATVDATMLKVQIGVLAGIDGRRYKITFTTTLDNTDIIEDELYMNIVET